MAQLLYWLLPTIVVTVALTVAIVYAIRRRLGGGESTRIQDVYAQPQAPNTQPTSKDIRPAVPSASVWHCKHCQYENASHMSFCDLCAESRNASSVGTNTGDVLIPVYQGVHVPMRRSPHLPPVAPSRLPTSAAASVPSRPPSLAPSSSSVLPAVATFAPASNSVPAPPTSMRDSTPMRNAQHSRDAPPGAPVSFSLTNSQRKRVKTEAELTFIRATNAVARGDLAAAFKDLNRALLLEPSNTKMMAYRALVVSKMSQPTSSSTSTSGATAAAAAAAATAATIEQDAAHLRRQRALRLCVERAAAARLHGDFKSALMEMKQALECDPSNTKFRAEVDELEAKLALVKNSRRRDFYKILGVADTAAEKEITKAFRNIALQHHPDKGFRKSEADRAASERIFRGAREAYEILLDPQRRREFDSGTGEFAAPNL